MRLDRKWGVLAFLCAIFVTYTVDRALLGLLSTPIQEETGLSDLRLGVLKSAVFLTYAAVVSFAGLAGDRFNRAKLIGLAALTWSLMTFLAGFAGGFWSLFVLVSFAIVVPQTIYSPTASALIASLHTTTRTIAMSCHQASFYTGWFVSGAAVAGLLALFHSWRAAFFSFGALGMVLGVAFLVFSCRQEPSTASAGNRTVVAKPSFGASLKAYFGCPSALLASVCYVVEVFVSWGYVTCGPQFVERKFGLTSSAAGTGVMCWHYAASFAAILCAGFLTDALVKRWPRFRLVLSTLSMALAIPALLLFGCGDSLPLVWTGAALLGAMFGVIGANQFTNLFDVIPSAHRAGAIGFLNVIAGLVGSLAPLMMGALSQHRGVSGFETGFSVFAAVQGVGIVALAISFFFTFGKDRLAE